MKETKGIAPVVIVVVIIVAIIAAAGVWYVTTAPGEEEEEEEEEDYENDPEEVLFSREQAFAWGANFLGPRGMNPVTILYMETGYDWPLMYEPLALLDPDGRWIPLLAEEWNWVDDYTLEIKIRPEAHFRKGQPVTAEDVKFSLDTLADSTISGILDTINYSGMVESVEVVDGKTLRLHTNEDKAPRNLEVYLAFLAPTRIFQKDRWSELLEEYGENIGDYANMDPEEINASGPYTLLSSTPASTIYVRVDDYWGNQLGWYYSPKYYQAVWCGTTEIATRALDDGDVDLGEVVGITKDWMEERKMPDGWLWMLNPGAPTLGEGVAFEMADFVCAPNMDREILRQPWLREAIAYAINYAKVIEVEATAEIGAQSGPYYLPFYLPPEYYNSDIVDEYYETETVAGVSVIKYDPEKAIEILSNHCTGSVEDGWTYEGEKIGPFDVLSWIEVAPIAAANEVIAKSLRDIGIEAIADQVLSAAYHARSTSGAFDFDVRWAYTGFGPFPDPITAAYNAYFLLQGTTWGGSKVDYKKYWDGTHPPLPDTAGQVEDLIDELWALEAGTDEFIAVVRQIQEIIIPQLPMIPLYQKIAPMMMSTRYWVNYPYVDDPLDYRPKAANEFLGTMWHVYPKSVETLDATLSSSTVEAGETVTVKVKLKNNGNKTYLYPVYVHNGPAAPGEYLYEPEKLLAHGTITIGPGKTKFVKLDVTFDTPGTYTLTVDDWRYSEWDPGEPIVLTLTVE